jgi:hypothetical protein
MRLRVFITSFTVAVAMTGVVVPKAQASKCPGTHIGGKTIGWIEFDDVRVPLKRFSYPAGGDLDPPPTAAVTGVSSLHRPLLSETGTTVLAWHVRYGKGCNGALNPILKRPVSSTFDIVTAQGERQRYVLVERTNVKRGKYKPEWFRTNGPAQIALFTCSDPRNGRFERTTALFAEPVPSDSRP